MGNDLENNQNPNEITNPDLHNFLAEKETEFLLEKDKEVMDDLAQQKQKTKQELLEIDAKMEAVQRSTRTLMPQFIRLHNYCRMRWQWYYNWNSKPYSSLVHWLVLSFYVIGLTILFLSVFFLGPTHKASAASHSTWSTVSEWKNWKFNNLTVTEDGLKLDVIENEKAVLGISTKKLAQAETPVTSEPTPTPSAPIDSTPTIPSPIDNTPVVSDPALPNAPPTDTPTLTGDTLPLVEPSTDASLSGETLPSAGTGEALPESSLIPETSSETLPTEVLPTEVLPQVPVQYKTQGTATITFNPQKNEVVDWLKAESSQILNGGTIKIEFSTDNILWTEDIKGLADSSQVYLRVTLNSPDPSMSPVLKNLSVNYSRLPITPKDLNVSASTNLLGLDQSISAGAFSDPDGDLHKASEWQVTDKAGQYSAPLADSGIDTKNLTTFTISKKLKDGTYFFRVRYQDSVGAWSPWSEESGFTVSKNEILVLGEGQVLKNPNEIVSERTETTKTIDNKNGTKTLKSFISAIHYKEDYASKDASWKDINPSHSVDYPTYVLYDQMPSTVKVYKDKIGYEIESRQTGEKYTVELQDVDGKPKLALASEKLKAHLPAGEAGSSKLNSIIDTVLAQDTTSADTANLKFEFDISQNGVRLWKTIEGLDAPKNFQWKVTKTGSGDTLKFRDKPEAFDINTAGDIVQDSQGQDKVVPIEAKKISGDMNSTFIWQETAPKSDMKIDTDVIVLRPTSDIYLNMTPSTGTDGYPMVNDVVADDDATTLTRVAMGVNYACLVNAPNIPDGATDIVLTLGIRASGGTFELDASFGSGSYSVYGDGITFTDWALSEKTFTTNPWDSDNPWTVANINTLDSLSIYNFMSGAVTQIYAEITYTPPGGGAVAPTVTTSAATDITEISVTGNGEVTADGGASISNRGFYLATDQSAGHDCVTITELGSTSATLGTGTGVYSTSLTGLTTNAYYCYRSYALNSVGMGYGAWTSFQPLSSVVAPTVTTSEASAITSTDATLNGNVTNDGGASVSNRGFYLATDQSVGHDCTTITSLYDHTAAGSGTGVYSLSTSAWGALTASTYYCSRSWAYNGVDMGYGAWTSFQTLGNNYTLTYNAGAGGSIVGTSPQTVADGANGTQVTATPSAGYYFVNWSDANAVAARTDTNVTADITVTANFALQFLSKWDTSKTSPGSSTATQIHLPLESTGTYNFVVDWGDSSTSTITTWNQAETTHTYASGGIYDLKIGGTLIGFKFDGGGDRLKLSQVSQFGPLRLGNSGYYFYGTTNLKITATDVLNMTGTTTMKQAFDGSGISTVPSMNSWDMSAVTSTMGMFSQNSLFNQDISDWNVANVTDMGWMFNGAIAFNQNIGSWNTGAVTRMSLMFNQAAAFNQNIGGWNTAAVTSMIMMFNGATAFNQSLAGWNIANVTDMGNMFTGSGLSTVNYSNILVGWSAQAVQSNVALGATAKKYTLGAAADGRAHLISAHTWTITDGGPSAFVLTYNAGSGGSIVGSSPQTIDYGANGTLVTATPAANYHFVKWSDNNSTTAARTDTNITATITTTATFAIDTRTLTYNAGSNGSIVGTTPQTVDHGASGAEVTATPSTGYYFVNWSDANTVATRTDTNVTADITVTANFALQFLSRWDTSKTSGGSSTATQIHLPLESTGTYNFVVDWGDSSTSTITTWNQAETTHTYASGGIYDLKIGGTLTGFKFNSGGDRLKLSQISQWGCLKLGNSGSYFREAYNLKVTATDVLNLTGTTNMYRAFSYTGIDSVPSINSWDVSAVTNMGQMFMSANTFNQNIGSWVTASVTDMNNMFNSASAFNQNIGSWNTGAVTNMSSMFQVANTFNQNINSWNTANVTNMWAMFASSTFNQNIGSWNTVAVTNMEYMFYYNSAFNQNIGNWNTVNVTNMANMFNHASAFNQNIGSWNTANVTNMTNMFQNVTLSTANYSNTLIGWSALVLKNNVTFSGGNSKYNLGAATDARNHMTSAHTWTITDGGPSAFVLTYNAGSGGSVVGSSPQTVDYGANGTLVTATPATNYHFVSWSDNNSTTATRTDTNITATLTTTATFAIDTFTLTYNSGSNGSVVGTSPQTVDYNTNGTEVVATPSTGYHFVSWSDAYPTAARTDINVTVNSTVSATFAIDTFTLTYSANANGSIVGTSPQTVNYGANGIEVVATPAAGYLFSAWSDGVLTAARTDLNVTGNITVSATFASVTITTTSSAGFTVSWNNNILAVNGFELYIAPGAADCATATYPATASYTPVFGSTSQVVPALDEINEIDYNTWYCAKLVALTSGGPASPLFAQPKYTFANKPVRPTVNTQTSNTVTVKINNGGNPASTEFAIKVVKGADTRYLKTDGTLTNNSTPVWATYAAFGGDTGLVNTGLVFDADYIYSVAARNGNQVITDYSDINTVHPPIAPTTCTWDGGGTDNNWSTATNWLSDAVPADGCDVIFNGAYTIKNSSIDSGFTNQIKSLLINTGYTGVVTAETDLTINGDFALNAGIFVASSYTLSIGGSVSMAASPTATFSKGTSTINFNPIDTGKTMTTNGQLLGNLTFNGVENIVSPSIKANNSVTLLNTGILVAGWTLQDSLNATSIVVSTGTLVDNVQAVTVAGNISIATNIGVLVSRGLWTQSASGSIANATMQNSFGSLSMAGAGVTTTLAGDLKIGLGVGVYGSLTIGDGTLMGNGKSIVYYQDVNDGLTIGSVTAGSNLSGLAIYPTKVANLTQKAITLPSNFATIVQFQQNPTAIYTATGNFNLANSNCLFVKDRVRTPVGYVDMNSHNLICHNLQIGNNVVGYTGVPGYLKLGSGVTTIIGNVAAGNALNVGNQLDFGAGSTSVAGNLDFTNIVVTPGASTVILNGVNQSIIGNNTFNNLTKSVTDDDTLTFGASSIQTIVGLLTLKSNETHLLSLVSSTPGSVWQIDPQGTIDLDYLDLSDAENLASQITLTHVKDSGGNINWYLTDSYSLTTTSPQVAGTGWSETLQAEDYLGNNSTSDSITTVTPVASSATAKFYTSSTYETLTTTYTLVSGVANIYIKDMNISSETITLTLTDSHDKTITSGNITVQNTAPTVTITSPINNLTVGAGTVQITGTATDALGGTVAKVEVTTNGGESWNVATGTTSWSYNFVVSVSGTYSIQARATDSLGLVGAVSGIISVKVDKEIPSVTITDPLPDVWITKAYVIKGTAVDLGLSPISVVEISTNGTTWNEATGTTDWTYSWDPTLDGAYIISARVTDVVLNVSQIYTVNVKVDRSGPTVPTALKAYDVSNRLGSSYQAYLSWKDSTDTGSGFKEYEIWRDSVKVGTSLESSYVDIKLTTQIYSYQVKVLDNALNISESEKVTVDLTGGGLSNLVISDISAKPSKSVTASGATTAMINWKTDRPGTSSVQYGLNSIGGKDTEPQNRFNTGHALALTDLKADTTYHYIVTSADVYGVKTVSTDQTFKTLSAPIKESIFQIILKTLQKSFDWLGQVVAASLDKSGLIKSPAQVIGSALSYDVSNLEAQKFEVVIATANKPNFSVQTSAGVSVGEGSNGYIVIKNLKQNEKYSYKIVGLEGVMSLTPGGEVDSSAPIVSDVVTKEISISKDSSEIMVSWQTDLLTTSEVDVNGKITKDDNLGQSHVVLIGGLKQATNYKIKIKAMTDKNQTLSKEYTLVTSTVPVDESIFEIILKKLQEIFGGLFEWMRT